MKMLGYVPFIAHLYAGNRQTDPLFMIIMWTCSLPDGEEGH